ncbi:dynamin family protein [uncultured Roseobacter sp.]|uniref:dynamin family protein n=1 Tax=uncultured Roseobacter sp. TaxID=114847 RepID=UPI0026386E45|nr:dynamin family protein [uncultured Roseobacter sp.]
MNTKENFSEDQQETAETPAGYVAPPPDALADFADRRSRLSAALQELTGLSGDSARKPIAKLQKDLSGFEPAVTFLGQVKSGKTTLVNAMAGWPGLLPSDVNPWTSVVTSVHLQPGQNRTAQNATFQMMKEAEWDRLVQKGGRLGELAERAGAEDEQDKIRAQVEALREKSKKRLGRKFELLLGQKHEYGYFDSELLERYICLGDDPEADDMPSRDTQGKFADITSSADLWLSTPTVPVPLCLRDTPGVNDTFMMREQVTINAVRTSRFCVVVLSAHQALSSVDMGLIRLISAMPSRDVLIFINRTDELADPVAEMPQIETGIRKVLARNNGPEEAVILFGSALWAEMACSGDIPQSDLERARGREDKVPAGQTRAETLWLASGLPALQQAIAEQIVGTTGNSLLRRIASDAATVASGQQAANKIRIEGDQQASGLTMQDIRKELDHLSERHVGALAETLGQLTTGFQERAERAHDGFLHNASAALVRHLENYGPEQPWRFSPDGLRSRLRSAASVYETRARNAAHRHYTEAVTDIAEFYFRAFGKAVEGVRLSVPETPDLPAPVSIAGSIALDFNQGWLTSWWRRTRGYKAFSRQFSDLISSETAEFLGGIKGDHTAEVTGRLCEVLAAFMAQNRDILFEIGDSRGDKAGLETLCLGADEARRTRETDALIDVFEAFIHDTDTVRHAAQ